MKMLLALFLALFCSACGISISALTDDAAKKDVRKEINRTVNPTVEPGSIYFERTEVRDGYEVYYFVYRSFRETGNVKNDFINGEFFRHIRPVKKFAVLLSGMGESQSTVISAVTLTKNGYDVIRVLSGIDIFDRKVLEERENFSKEDFISFVREGRNTMQTRYFDLYALTRYFRLKYGYEKVGISGVSLGGITATYLAGKYPGEYQSLVGIVTGGNLAHILSVSVEPGIEKMRNAIFKKFTVTPQVLFATLEHELADIDPLSVAGNINPKKMLLITNCFDPVIPRIFTEELWRKAHKPEWWIITVPGVYLPKFGWPPYKYVNAHLTSFISIIMPMPIFSTWLPIPTTFKSADIAILQHFEKTL